MQLFAAACGRCEALSLRETLVNIDRWLVEVGHLTSREAGRLG
jgi:hypothetical protein